MFEGLFACVCSLSATLQLHQAPMAAFPESFKLFEISSFTPTPKHSHTRTLGDMRLKAIKVICCGMTIALVSPFSRNYCAIMCILLLFLLFSFLSFSTQTWWPNFRARSQCAVKKKKKRHKNVVQSKRRWDFLPLDYECVLPHGSQNTTVLF